MSELPQVQVPPPRCIHLHGKSMAVYGEGFEDDPDYQEGSVLLANTIMSPEFQTAFNQAKGSIPARMDVDLSQGFNPCQVKSQEDLAKAIEQGTLVRSMAHNMTVPQAMRGAMMEVITEFVNSDMAPEDAANAMADAVEANM